MGRFGFCGGSYQSESPVADAEWTINLYPETIESGEGKSAVGMYGVPGLTAFCTLPDSPARGELAINGMLFVVAGTSLLQIDSAGSATTIGSVASDGKPVSMCANQTYLFFVSGLFAYYYNFNTGSFSSLTNVASSFTYTITASGANQGVFLANNGGIAISTATETGNICTVVLSAALSTPTSGYSPQSGDPIVIAGVGVAGYNGTFTIATISSDLKTVTYYNSTSGLGASSGGTATYYEIDVRVSSFSGSNSPTQGLIGGQVTLSGVGIATYNTPLVCALAYRVVVGSPRFWIVCRATTAIIAANPVAGGSGTATLNYGPISSGFCDGYFIQLFYQSQRWQISSLNDASTWSSANVSGVSIFPDFIVSMLVDHREVFLFGQTKATAYEDTGASPPLFPFSPITGVYIEQGCSAPASPTRADNSVFWLGQDDRGWMVCWRVNGYTPVRVSNHSLENIWNGYGTVSDAIGFSYQEEGHTFYVVSFPTANATWAYDVATESWHQRGEYISGPSGATWTFNYHKAQFHAFCFGKHLVGNLSDNVLYQQSIALNDDNGAAKQWVRRSPVISLENEWMTHSRFYLEMEPGLDNSNVLLRWSDDFGKTWNTGRTLSTGAIGAFSTRIVARRLGRSRHRIYELSGSGIAHIIDAYVEAEPTMQPAPRLSERLRQAA